jgi:1,4-dihydroxy-6-naphthoate synthase
MNETPGKIRIGHSPDPDDAFMYYGIACGAVDTRGLEVEQVLEDIESLNRRAMEGELEVTAVSMHAYAHLVDRYALMPCGASMGDGYGPMIVAREAFDPSELAGKKIAIPGLLTSAHLALQQYLGRADYDFVVTPFDKILDVVKDGTVDAGLVIHEGQLTYADEGLVEIVNLGIWFGERTGGLPLPLGGNVVRKDLGPVMVKELTRIIRDSIIYGLDHRQEALDYAIDFGRGLDMETNDKFVGMYVNDLTRDYGTRGRAAVERFLGDGADAGLLPSLDGLEFVELDD